MVHTVSLIQFMLTTFYAVLIWSSPHMPTLWNILHPIVKKKKDWAVGRLALKDQYWSGCPDVARNKQNVCDKSSWTRNKMHTLQSVRYAIFKVLWYYWIDLPSKSESKSGSKMDILQLDHYVCVCVCVYIYIQIYPSTTSFTSLKGGWWYLICPSVGYCGCRS